jgi:diguanylate cyclase (GGDEF)-like protein
MRGSDARDRRRGRPVRGISLSRHATGSVASTRRLFTICFLVCLAVCLPNPLVAGTATARTLLVTSATVLCLTWIHRYRDGSAPPALDLADAAATCCFAAACPVPGVALGFVFSSVWGRALYGSVAGLATALTATLAGLAAALPLWQLVPGHGQGTPASPVLGSFPVLILTTVAARHLAVGIFALEQARRRDAALSELGVHLLAAPDRRAIHEHAWTAVETICDTCPGLMAALIRLRPDGAYVLRRSTGLVGLAAYLPRLRPADLPPPSRDGPPVAQVAVEAALLRGATGVDGRWTALRLADPPGTLVLVGHPRRLPAEGTLAVRSVMNQVTLASRNTEVRARLAVEATTDPLTGLANRRAFRSALHDMVRDRTAEAVLFLDLDDFKNVNDEFGHAAGDDVLRRVAERIEECARAADLCARLGGDEFAVLLAAGADADDIAERLVTALSAPLTVRGRRLRVGASVGIAPVTGSTACEDLLHRADIAMYSAKTAGKNCARRFDFSPTQPTPRDITPRFGT